jgi:integrase
LSRRTADKYDRLLRLQIAPKLGGVDLVDITLLRAVLNTALDDELIRGRNPCRIKGADKDDAPERPMASVEQVYPIATAIKPWYRTMVLLSATTGLRWGELVGLRRHNVDLDERFVRVTEAAVELDGLIERSRTKSAAGARTVGIPAVIVDELAAHLDQWSEVGPSGRVFGGPKGATPRRTNFNRLWTAALRDAAKAGAHGALVHPRGADLPARAAGP